MFASKIHVRQYCPFQLVTLDLGSFSPSPSIWFIWTPEAVLKRMSVQDVISKKPSGHLAQLIKTTWAINGRDENVLLCTSNPESHVWYIDTKIIPEECFKLVFIFACFSLNLFARKYVYQDVLQHKEQNSHSSKEPLRALNVTDIG